MVKGSFMSLTSEQELEMYSDIKMIKRQVDDLAKFHQNHETRIQHLENKVNTLETSLNSDKKWVYGIFSGLGAVGAWIFSQIVQLIEAFKG